MAAQDPSPQHMFNDPTSLHLQNTHSKMTSVKDFKSATTEYQTSIPSECGPPTGVLQAPP